MSMTLNPYLSFRDTARPAMEFYRSVFGGDLAIDTFAAYDMGQDPAENDLVMHAQLDTPRGFTLMASDTPGSLPYAPPAGFAVSLSGDDDRELEGYWRALSDGGAITMPLETPPWGGRFGMLTDRFGVDWMVSIAPQG
ncbi:VOC family protein [Microbacterium lushaniae]|uniref:VOC family protein n=1 Tax=Microbacterium lushaniae TaxID=2614639 RepID=A0A5J6L6V6_9MICO|nr:VOC family protein [Microbacterium lushaniae]QEW04175.1 VOC family protein [Microbacterium lushaniae]